jgi:hypothetical protein
VVGRSWGGEKFIALPWIGCRMSSASLSTSWIRSRGPASVSFLEFSWSITPSSDLLDDTWNRRSITFSATS